MGERNVGASVRASVGASAIIFLTALCFIIFKAFFLERLSIKI